MNTIMFGFATEEMICGVGHRFPDFALTERLWFADPEVERRVQIEILNTEGFEGPVTLSLVDLPDGVTVN